VLVTGVRENTVYAVLQLVAGDEEIDVDSRPSDAIALAVRTETPIFVSTELLATNGIEFEQQQEDVEEVVKEFKTFLNQVSPEDF